MNKRQLFTSLGLAVSSALLPVSAEVIPGTTVSINFESSHMVGSGRHLNIMRVPVTNIDTGETTLFDASFNFTFDPEDGFTFGRVISAAISPPITSIANIIPGVYFSQRGYCYQLEGPTALDANRSLYTVRAVFNEGCNANTAGSFTAQIVSGTASGHPDIGAREIVPNLADTYVYGMVANGESDGRPEINTDWGANELIGVRQSGEQLIIGLLSEGEDNDGAPVDFRDPRATVILTKLVE